jgi:hypothetical protein
MKKNMKMKNKTRMLSSLFLALFVSKSAGGGDDGRG